MTKEEIRKILETNDKEKIKKMMEQFLAENPPTEEEKGSYYADRVTDAIKALMPVFEAYEDLQEDFIETLRDFNAKAKILEE
ncbi:MAG: hypothetical protein COU07_00505 [Candidatus Harrisonbacteria bacterium CG10_big_fil_rev_8_21_14_0_10_40_38]|uniref:Uncharacterized protein n=1 Tax=Candidatus Harrisonbacteria bacterium CG10_big_fil_rev_8_21_14_0_10_40_38 TaxID=1974583 RepID=A0A2H0UUP2_9BACT|nr:MAG: hypothetical protein COU07_00505 [Candidatus Harrisonbacteria bacterium CG10_big_fil_rev_8_21_14_0_10_40_38]